MAELTDIAQADIVHRDSSHQRVAVFDRRRVPLAVIERATSPYDILTDTALEHGRNRQLAYVMSGPHDSSVKPFDERLQAVLDNPDLYAKMVSCGN